MTIYIDRITDSIKKKHILITGATGFIGKVLVEKLLRECPEVGGIYLLIRAKKGKTPQIRIKDLFADPLFEKLNSLYGTDLLVKKCKAIEGDVSEINLGINDSDRKLMQENINIIYHIAATVRFDEPLKSALLMNTRGTKFMIELAKECKNLQVFCYVSTAYVHPVEKVLFEKAYPPAAEPNSTIETIEKLSTEEVNVMTSKFLGNLPNTYTFTKSLSEDLIIQQMNKLPVVIVRPSVVVPIWKEPVPGWGQNLNGPIGLLIGAGKGVVRSMYCDGNCYADFVPVDVAVNGMCLCVWDYLTHKERRIYNLTSSDEIRYTWNEIINTGKKIVTTTIPFNSIPWYPGGGIKNSKIIHYLAVFFFQLLPAVFVDILLFCLGYKPILIKIQIRIIKGYELLEFYATNQWNFDKRNSFKVRSMLNPIERKIYYTEKENFNMEEYISNTILGARRFVIKEADDTLPAARRHLKIMWCIDQLFKIIILVGIVYFLYQQIYLKVFIN